MLLQRKASTGALNILDAQKLNSVSNSPHLMKIALLTPTFSKFSGPDRVVENEATELSRNGHDVTVYAFRGDIKPNGYRVMYWGMPRNPTLERLYRLFFFLDIRLIKYVKEMKRYDRLISFLYPMTIIATTAQKYYNVRYTYYNMGVAYPHLFSKQSERIYMHIFNTFTNFTVKNANDAISISEFLKKELQRETGLKSRVKPVYVDKNYGDVKQKEVAKLRRKLGNKTVLFVGRLSPHKGVHLLIRAMRLVRKEVPDAQLIVVGKATFDDYGKALKKEPHTIFTGFVPDDLLPLYYSATNLYATASLWEGFDIPAVQAQRCGKRVVAFDVGSHREVVKNGVLVKRGNVEELARAIIRELRSEQQ